MSRWKAAAIHLSISLTIGLIVGSLLLFVWYPPPLFHAAGADELALLLVSVDLALGPLLTLVVFKAGKKGLQFDLTLIAALQAAALVYGMSVVLHSRPVFIATAVDRFVLVFASDLSDADLAEGRKPEFRSRSLTGPLLVGTQIPSTAQERSTILSSSIIGKDVESYPKYYVNYDAAAPALLKRAKPLGALKINDANSKDVLDSALVKTGLPVDHVVWVPLVARKATLVMLLNRDNGQPLRAVPINPWTD